MSIRLGIAPIAWSNDDMPELGGKTPLEQCLKEASLAGFTGVEYGGKFAMNSNELIPKLNKENLKLCSGWYGAQLLKRTPKEEFKLMQKQLKLFQDCKSPCMVFAEVTGSVQGDPKIPLSKRPKLSKDDWNKLINSLVHPLMYLVRAVTPQMIERKSGKIIAITSAAPLKGIPNNAAYCAARGAQNGFIKAAGLELARSNVQVNAIAQNYINNN